ncbi:nuclear transport factor 2 family protein [Extensimonas vulgaris]|uniref:Steroid delta-isomerase n=1 Tax=Extensimonas vulgaris TaxID=1031594 RepID=A0A369ANR5_9BURK|nr:nuclear transport factor 2 family protein [Extensimonas vulgaris]RCX11020.1 steroid delta-isomerase [Extensimonas vulgaris]TWI41694.1 steroid delta-isomerase [Extensimonas vulgaris]TXD16159.1 nuclear transport factor 2 family protein [Extensimonas vulgaris]
MTATVPPPTASASAPPACEAHDAHDATARVVALFANFGPAQLPLLDQYYAAQARFKDPFHDVQGVPAITAIFAHMFEALHAPRFVFIDQIIGAQQAFLTWDLHFRFRRWRAHQPERIHGATHLRFDAQGRITLHRDYWDSAEELFEKFPLLGPGMRWLRKRAAA